MQIDDLSLPAELLWTDEFGFDAVAQALTRTEGGALIVEETALVAGRLITLTGSRNATWISRADLIELRALADDPLASYTLTLNDAREFTVMFRRPAIAAEQLAPFQQPVDTDWYVLLGINLITV